MSGELPGTPITFRLFRVDDRLLHGQVALGWGRHLAPHRYHLADDRLADDPEGAAFFQLAAPEGIPVSVSRVDPVLPEVPDDERRATVLLVRDLEAAARLVAGGIAGPVNLGGLHAGPGAHQILPYLFLSDDDVHRLRRLVAGGTECYAQDLPENARLSSTELFRRIDEAARSRGARGEGGTGA